MITLYIDKSKLRAPLIYYFITVIKLTRNPNSAGEYVYHAIAEREKDAFAITLHIYVLKWRIRWDLNPGLSAFASVQL